MNIEKGKIRLLSILENTGPVKWLLLVLVTTVFTLVLYPNTIIRRHDYALGDVAERDIKAPRDFLIEDLSGTEKKRRQAEESVLTVYDHNTILIDTLRDNVTGAFSMMHTSGADADATDVSDEDASGVDIDGASTAGDHRRVRARRDAFEKKLGISVSAGAFTILEKEAFSLEIPTLILGILERILAKGVVSNKELLLKDAERGIRLRVVDSHEEKTIHNLEQFYGLDQAKAMVRIVGKPLMESLNYTSANLVVDFTQRLIQPNITLNRRETEDRKAAAAAAVKPIFYKIKAGEMLLREGERVTEMQLLKLKNLRQQSRLEKGYVRSLGGLILILSMLIIVYFIQTRHPGNGMLSSNKAILFLSVMLIIFFLLPNVSEILFKAVTRNTPILISDDTLFAGIPMAAGAMTVCLFLRFGTAISFAAVLSACAAVMFQGRFEVFLYFFLSGVMGAYWMQNCRERKVFIKAGIRLGFLNVLLVTGAAVYIRGVPGFDILWDWVLALLSGIAAGIITAGIVPMLEMAFGYTTDITLMELANLEQPILRRLMMEAPGTYHHSVVVGSMVEAAAAEIGANPILAKVCGYYHDIGKINKPLYFIENQMRCENRHDKLAPSMSSLILISHVKEGVELAKKHKLGREIMTAIQQHHGTSLIRFFYDKAVKLRGEQAVKMENFRYPGPKPETREIGLVMLADVVEAASRTLENPNPSRIQGLVQSLINKIFSDGQLDYCELTLKDLHSIAKSFNKILNGIHHHRIEYPEKSAAKDDKENHERTDHQQPKSVQRFPGKPKEDGADHLKRLGL
ncbi:HD family phosphohydrolase [Desulfococcus sp.]|uniref:HD family phosphohydrolase n=1 Tax=Desulfococcus sp. TaxID=2025834 RepID=UPI003D0CAAEE